MGPRPLQSGRVEPLGEVQLRRRIASFPRWHYEFDLSGVRTPIASDRLRIRHQERRRYFFDPLVELCGGTLVGKRVLDLGCNAGFWSLCAIEAGCKFVLGVDGRRTHIDQAELVFEQNRVATDRYRFVAADVFDLELDSEGRFDVVLCLGLLYHVSDPAHLIERIADWNSDLLLIDTSLSPGRKPRFAVEYERTDDPSNALTSERVLVPSRDAVLELVRAAGYSAVTLEPRFTTYRGSFDYWLAARRAFLGAKRTELDPLAARIEANYRRPLRNSIWVAREAGRRLRRVASRPRPRNGLKRT